MVKKPSSRSSRLKAAADLASLSTIIIVIAALALGFLLGSLWQENKSLKTQQPVTNGQEATAPTEEETAELLKNVPTVNDQDHVIGATDGKVVMISYSDYECPYCNRWHPTWQSLIDKYGDQITFVYRHFPLSFHPHAEMLAEASECIADNAGNEAFWSFTNSVYEKMADESIYTTQGASSVVTEETVLALAAAAGADRSQVQSCLDSGEKASIVNTMMQGGQSAGVGGTPSTIVISAKGGYDIIPGALPLAEVETILANHL